MDFPAENSFEAVPLPGPSIPSDQVRVQITQVYFLIATANGSEYENVRNRKFDRGLAVPLALQEPNGPMFRVRHPN